MKQNKHALLKDLYLIAENALITAQAYKNLSEQTLNYKPNPESWSILECLEHLNLYGDFYIPAIEKSILNSPTFHGPEMFNPGIFGNYFANLMKGKNGKIKKIKSPKDKNPANSNLNIGVIDRFIKQTESLKHLLKQAEKVSLNKAKTPISISNLIKLKLGDTFRFYVYHIERHIRQSEKIKMNNNL